MNKKYVILTASYGNGHNAAKDSIKSYLEENGNQVLVIDLVDLISKSGTLSKKYYSFASEDIPAFWALTFKILDLKITDLFLEKYLTLLFQKKFNEILYSFDPDYIIGVYPTWQNLVLEYKEKINPNVKYGVMITDSTINLQWYSKDKIIDKFFVISEELKESLENKLPNRKNDIIQTFFPIREKYFINKQRLKNKNIYILLSSFKEELTIEILNKLKKENFYEKVVIIKGRNEKLYKLLKEKFNCDKFDFHEFIDIKNELKNIDIFITKPGGALVCECIAQDVFVISPFYIRGQEEGNIELLEKNNLGFFSNDSEKIINFLKNDYKNINMENFKKVKNKDSIKDLINNLK